MQDLAQVPAAGSQTSSGSSLIFWKASNEASHSSHRYS